MKGLLLLYRQTKKWCPQTNCKKQKQKRRALCCPHLWHNRPRTGCTTLHCLASTLPQDASDHFREGEGSLLPLWRFSTDRTKRKQVRPASDGVCISFFLNLGALRNRAPLFSGRRRLVKDQPRSFEESTKLSQTPSYLL